jgi:hypothetical protein
MAVAEARERLVVPVGEEVVEVARLACEFEVPVQKSVLQAPLPESRVSEVLAPVRAQQQ